MSELGKSKRDIYKSIKLKKPFKAEARVMRAMDNGNYVHERYMKYFIEMGILIGAEIDVDYEDLIRGRLDAIITNGEENFVVEIKSCSQWVFNKLKKPNHAHYLQLQFYLFCTNIKKGIMLYENKDNNVIKCFPVDLDKELVEGYISELKELKRVMDDGIIPEDKPIEVKE